MRIGALDAFRIKQLVGVIAEMKVELGHTLAPNIGREHVPVSQASGPKHVATMVTVYHAKCFKANRD
jgi:hypothetical protein